MYAVSGTVAYLIVAFLSTGTNVMNFKNISGKNVEKLAILLLFVG
jgi:hypothetical protein